MKYRWLRSSKVLIAVPLLLLLAGIAVACGDDATPTAPATSTSPAPTATYVTGSDCHVARADGYVTGSDCHVARADGYVTGSDCHLTGAHGYGRAWVLAAAPGAQPQVWWDFQTDHNVKPRPLRRTAIGKLFDFLDPKPDA